MSDNDGLLKKDWDDGYICQKSIWYQENLNLQKILKGGR